jgi:cold shock CspA family protein
MFDGDLFVGTRSNPHLPRPLQEGDEVDFVVADKGGSKAGFEAVEVSFAYADMPMRRPQFGGPPAVRFMDRGGDRQRGRDRSRSPRARRGDAPGPEKLVGQVVVGQIRSFRGTWGFIVSDSFDGDIFVGTKSNGHLPSKIEPNQPVQFEVAHGAGGKLEAMNVQLI